MSKTTFFDIIAAMRAQTEITLIVREGTFTGFVKAIELESGNGRTWNVTMEARNAVGNVSIFFDENTDC